MRKLINKLTLLTLAILIFSCEEGFDPYSELKEEYHLYCVLRDDTNIQTIKIIQSYMGEELNPELNTQEPAIEGARIWVRSNRGDAYVFKEGYTNREQETKYGTNTHYYYHDNFTPDPTLSYEVEALLPNGMRLTSFIEPTPPIQFMWVNCQKLYPPADFNQTAIAYVWNQNYYDEGHPYIARLNILYSVDDGPIERFPVPLSYVTEGDSTYGIYRTISSDNFISFRNIIVDEAMLKLSENEPLKDKFTIYKMELEASILNRSLSNYYESTIVRAKSLSLVLNEVYYTNIENGKGIFGLQAFGTFNTNITEEYVRSYGYNYGTMGVNNE